MQLSSSGFPSPSPYLSLLLTALVVMGSPGPATIGVTAVGAAFGVRLAVPYVAGVVAGTLGVLLAVAVGLTSVLAAHPRLTPALVGVAVAYILYLAYRIATAPPIPPVSGRLIAPGLTSGLVLAAANPKAYAAIATVFTGSRLGLPSPAVETFAKIAILTALIVLIHVGWLWRAHPSPRLCVVPDSREGSTSPSPPPWFSPPSRSRYSCSPRP